MSCSRLARPALALALAGGLCLAAAAPAAASSRGSDRPASPLTAFWDALSTLWSGLGASRHAGPRGPAAHPAAEEGGPHMDPNGLTTPPGAGDGHPHMDPDGSTTPPAEGDGGPHMDPDG